MIASRALIIEDDLDTAALYGHILEFLGFQTETIQSGEKALTRLRQITPDIVLLDMRLSYQVTGEMILDYIRQAENLRECRVIVITGHPNMVTEIEHKADMVLMKPIDAKQLSTLILRLCPNHVRDNFLHNASHDPVTGLMNYFEFKERVDHAMGRAKRVGGLNFGIIFLQVVNMVALKQDLGQLGLNQVLLEMVTRLKRIVREVDIFSRLKDDKFAIFLEDLQDPTNIDKITKRIESVLEKPYRVEEQTVVLATDIHVSHGTMEEDLKAFVEL